MEEKFKHRPMIEKIKTIKLNRISSNILKSYFNNISLNTRVYVPFALESM